jgi:hypothetical protein|tara:strand:+ start:3009 stop:3131 length:123 start_codon:yes stop_codon:yes gene_type:complete
MVVGLDVQTIPREIEEVVAPKNQEYKSRMGQSESKRRDQN